MLVIYFGLRYWATGNIIQGAPTPLLDNPLVAVPFGERIRTALWVFGFYFLKIIWPVHQSADYSYNQIQIITTWIDWHWVFGLIILVGFIYIFFMKRINRVIRLGIGFYLVGFALTSNLVYPITNIMAERFAYFPIFGLALSAYGGLRSETTGSGIFRLAISSLIVLFGMMSFERSQVWANNTLLFRSLIIGAPNSARANYVYAQSLAENGQEQAAKAYAAKSIQIYPDYYQSYVLLTKYYFRHYMLDSAHWAIEKAVSIYPDEYSTHLKSIIDSTIVKIDRLKDQKKSK